MKKILVLGAGIYQVPLIKKAKEMGIYTIVASIPGKYPGFNYADKIVYENTTDKETLLAVAKQENVDGVVVCGTDVAVPTQGYICDRLGLKGPTFEAAVLAQDKAKMKKAFMKGGVRTADVRYVKLENSNPLDICLDIGYPVIFKSIDASGSRGITKVLCENDVPYAYEQVKQNTRADLYLIEKYLEGEEFGAQAFIFDNELQFVLPHGDYVFQGDTGVPIGHYAPFDMSDDIIEDARKQLTNAVKALGINNCAINADFILSGGETFVLEIGARAGATCLAEMTSLYYGYDYYEKIIQSALGEKPDFTPLNTKRQPSAEMLFRASRSGTLEHISIPRNIDKKIVDLSFDYSVGNHVKEFRKGTDRIGQIIAVGDTVAEAKRIIDETMNKVEISIV